MQIEKNRFGLFLVFIGLVLLVIFFTTDQANTPRFGFFIIGVAALYLGGALVWRNRKPKDEETRFRTLRRIRQKRSERKARNNHE